MNARIEEIVLEIQKSNKYRTISKETIEDIVATILPRYKKQKDIVKAVKNQLHVTYGAFFPNKCHQEALELIESGKAHGKLLSKELLQLHSSTKERLPVMEEFYSFLRPYTEVADSILDIGCGFHPLAFPFMHTKEQVQYTACDINSATLEVISAYGNYEECPFKTFLSDLAVELPGRKADVVFAFKLLPVLEQRKKGLGQTLLRALVCRYLIVTFPIKSLSGREKGMAAFYSNYMDSMKIAETQLKCQKVIGNELVYILEKTNCG